MLVDVTVKDSFLSPPSVPLLAKNVRTRSVRYVAAHQDHLYDETTPILHAERIQTQKFEDLIREVVPMRFRLVDPPLDIIERYNESDLAVE